jgi:predicted DNA-binding WGR domain protein
MEQQVAALSAQIATLVNVVRDQQAQLQRIEDENRRFHAVVEEFKSIRELLDSNSLSDSEPAPKHELKGRGNAQAVGSSRMNEQSSVEKKQASILVRVDRLVPNCELYSVFNEYHVMLSQANIAANNSKFYVIQLLEKTGIFSVFTRWGRVGEQGQCKLDPCDDGTLPKAIKNFERKFREKTKNDWNSRAFVIHPGMYQLVQVDLNE